MSEKFYRATYLNVNLDAILEIIKISINYTLIKLSFQLLKLMDMD